MNTRTSYWANWLRSEIKDSKMVKKLFKLVLYGENLIAFAVLVLRVFYFKLMESWDGVVLSMGYDLAACLGY
jgi:hypothetical protein